MAEISDIKGWVLCGFISIIIYYPIDHFGNVGNQYAMVLYIVFAVLCIVFFIYSKLKSNLYITLSFIYIQAMVMCALIVSMQAPTLISLEINNTVSQNSFISVTVDADDARDYYFPGKFKIYYKFSIIKNDTTKIVGNWSMSNKGSWNTTDWNNGDYQIRVDIGDDFYNGDNHRSDDWDTYNFPLSRATCVTEPPAANNSPPRIDWFRADPPSNQTAGLNVRFKASATDDDLDSILYKFTLKYMYDGEENTIDMTGWNESNEWPWTTTQYFVGDDLITVFVKDGKNISNEFDSSEEIIYTIKPNGIIDPPLELISFIPDKPSPQLEGTIVTWTAAVGQHSGQISYMFNLSGPSTGNLTKTQQNWSTTKSWKWPTSSRDVGTNSIEVRIKDSTTGQEIARDQSFTINPVPNQPPVVNSLNPNPESPQLVGTNVVWTADASGPEPGDKLYYRFYLNGPSTGGSWDMVKDWNTTNSWDWTPLQPGYYEVNAWIRDGEHVGTDSWDACKITPFTVNPIQPAPNQPPVFNSLTPAPASSQNVGTPIKWTADASGPEPGDTIYYRFFLKGPTTGGTWQQVQDWDTKNWWDWAPSQQGSYEVNVWIRDGKHAGTDTWDAYKITPFNVNPAPVVNEPPIFNSLKPNPLSPQNVGTSIRWTADASGPEPGDTIYYRFFLKGPTTGGTWQQVQDWDTKNWWDWAPSQQGSYEVNVWIRDGKHAGTNSSDANKTQLFIASVFPPDRPQITPEEFMDDIRGKTIDLNILNRPIFGDGWKKLDDIGIVYIFSYDCLAEFGTDKIPCQIELYLDYAGNPIAAQFFADDSESPTIPEDESNLAIYRLGILVSRNDSGIVSNSLNLAF